MSSDHIFALFVDPPKSWRIQPFWFLNHGFDEAELRRQIAEMDDKGVGGVVLHCRHGLLIEYMSRDWLDMIGVCVDELNRRGMEAWLYDEDDWPSGTVGGKLTRPHPEYRMRYLRIQEFRVTGGVTFQATLEPGDNELLCIQAWQLQDDASGPGFLVSQQDESEQSGLRTPPLDNTAEGGGDETGTQTPAAGLSPVVGPPLDITACYAGGKLQWRAPGGKWLVAVFWECPVAERVTFDRAYYLDTMNPEAVERFKWMAYAPYLRFRQHFGKTIKGVFTDEPGLMIHDGFFGTEAMRTTVENPHGTLPGVIVAWTRDFLKRFQELKGYDLKPWLVGLVRDLAARPPLPSGEGAKRAHATARASTTPPSLSGRGAGGVGPLSTTQLRCDYYDALTTWYVEAYHANLSGWCQAHGLEYIGHTLEDPLWGAVRSQGNQVRVLEQFHRPGLDYLGHGVGTRDNPFRILAVKCAASVAHVQGKSRVMCEAFGGSGHGHTLADRRLDANFMACLGVNMFIPHAFYFSFQGIRKTDWPPTEFYHAPFWPWYKHFADYLARLSLIQSTGYHVSEACILIPLKTVQVDMFVDGKAVRAPAAQQLFDRLSDLMLRLHHDYDYVDESQLERAQVKEGRITFPGSQETYPLIILPACRVITAKTARLLAELFAAGGRILALGELPAEADTPADRGEVQALMEQIFGAGKPGEERRHHGPGGGVALFQPAVADDLQVWLQQTVPQLITPDVIIDDEERRPSEDILCSHRTDGERHYYLLVNRTKQPVTGTLRLPDCGLLQEWSLEDARRTSIADLTREDGRICYQLHLEGAQARLIVVTPGEQLPEGIVGPPELQVVEEIKLDPQWAFDVGGENVFILDKWEFVARDGEAGPRHGVGVPGQVNTYRTTFVVDACPPQLKLVLDDVEQDIPSHVGFLSRRRNLEIFVNGQAAPPLEPSTWQDRYFVQTDIASLVQPGVNMLQIAMISLLEPFQHLNEPAYLVGSFAVLNNALAAEPGVVHGPFNEQGYPHFAGIARHSQTVDIPQHYLTGHRLLLDPGEVYDCCRVVVNGQEVAVRLWPPFEVDITAAAQPGANEIVVEVANSLANLYDKESRPSGLVGPAVIRVVK